jgi:monoterpene epsilon-lactone hydrolase
MPSWQARCANVATRLLIRRRDWGSEGALTRRARLLFGAPVPHRWLCAYGVRRERVRDGVVRGEWLTPRVVRRGVILYIHGGGYVACSPGTHRPIAAALARLSGRCVLSLDYRRAPEHRFPAAIDDVFAAYRWLSAHVGDARSIALAGDSAGGGLVLALLQQARAAGLPLPACAVGLSPWTDLAGTSESVRANDGRCAMFRRENIAQFASVYLGAASPYDVSASPVYGEMHGLPPLLLQVGSTELLLDDARRVHEAVLAVGGQSTLQLYDDVLHCWQMLDGLVPESRAALKEIAAFVDTHLPADSLARSGRRV